MPDNLSYLSETNQLMFCCKLQFNILRINLSMEWNFLLFHIKIKDFTFLILFWLYCWKQFLSFTFEFVGYFLAYSMCNFKNMTPCLGIYRIIKDIKKYAHIITKYCDFYTLFKLFCMYKEEIISYLWHTARNLRSPQIKTDTLIMSWSMSSISIHK